MKVYLQAFAMCQSMFCAIPSPFRVWEEKARDKMLLFLPLVGLEMGLIWGALSWVLGKLGLPPLVIALAVSMYPYLATGFLHLDGFMDVTDAVKSCRDLQRRREILKDSHVGSFAVIACAMLLLSQFALVASAQGGFGVLVLLPMVSRCGSALAVTVLKPMSTSQYASQHFPKEHVLVLGLMLCIALAAGFLVSVRTGVALIGCLAGYGWALRRGYRSLEGMNGDIAGYALTLGELWGLGVYALL